MTPSRPEELEAIQRRIMVALVTSQALFTTSTIAAFTLTSVIAVEMSGSEALAGTPTTLTLAGRAAMAYPIGWLMDRIGRRWGLSLGYLWGILGGLVSAWGVLNGSLVAFLGGALLIGMMRAAAEQGRYVAAEVFPAGRRAASIGNVVFVGAIGSIVGPLLVPPAGRWAQALGMPEGVGPFLLSSILTAVAMLVIFVLLRPDPLRIGRQVADAEPDAAEQRLRPARTLRAIFSDGLVRLAVLSMVTGQLVMTLLMVITPVHMNHAQHDTTAISWVIMAHTLGMFGLSSVTGRLVHRFGRQAMIMAGSLVLVAACVLAPLAGNVPLLAVALFLLGLGWNFCFVAGSTLLADRISAAERGRTQGAGEVLVALASGVGSQGTGVLFGLGGMAVVGALGFALVLFLVVTLAFTPRPEQEALSPTHLGD